MTTEAAGGRATTALPGPADAARWDAALDWLLRLAEAPRSDPATHAAFRAWCGEDPRNLAAFERAQATWTLAGAVPARMRVRQPPRRWRRRAVLAAGLAAGTAVLAPRLDRRLATDLATGVGEVAAHRLPDGSLLTLDTASAVAIDLAAAPRLVGLMAGRVFVDVAPGPDSPFIVTAGEMAASAREASFAVGLIDARQVEVAVAGGRVEIAAYGRREELVGGWAERVDSMSAVTRRRIAPETIGAWRTGRLVVEDRPVAEAVAELVRYHRGLMLVRDPALAAARLSGVFDLAEPTRALAAMVAPHGGRVRRFTDLLLVVDRG